MIDLLGRLSAGALLIYLGACLILAAALVLLRCLLGRRFRDVFRQDGDHNPPRR